MRFVIGITAVQVLWLLRLALPDERAVGVASFVVLAVVELAIPIWAERAAPGQQFHAGHLAERFGLFTIIVLGEVILSSTSPCARRSTPSASSSTCWSSPPPRW